MLRTNSRETVALSLFVFEMNHKTKRNKAEQNPNVFLSMARSHDKFQQIELNCCSRVMRRHNNNFLLVLERNVTTIMFFFYIYFFKEMSPNVNALWNWTCNKIKWETTRQPTSQAGWLSTGVRGVLNAMSERDRWHQSEGKENFSSFLNAPLLSTGTVATGDVHMISRLLNCIQPSGWRVSW